MTVPPVGSGADDRDGSAADVADPSAGGGAPIACTLEAGKRSDRLADWQAILDHARSRSTIPGGALRIAFDETVDPLALTSLVAAEQRCCAFFAFAITIDQRGIALEVSAPEAARETVDALFGSSD